MHIKEENKVYIKEEIDTTEDKSKKRGIAELNDGSNHSPENDSQEIFHQRQRLPLHPPVNPYMSTIIGLYDDPNNVSNHTVTNENATDPQGPFSPLDGKAFTGLPKHPEVRKL